MKALFDKLQPKTESRLYAKIRGVMARDGLIIRMENLIIPGLPDCLYMYKGKTIFIELKVLRSGKISMPKFQYSMAIEMLKHLNPNHHWYWVHEDDGLGKDIIAVYRFRDISEIVPEYESANKSVKLDLRHEAPSFIFTKPEDIVDWFILLNDERNH